MLPSLRLLSKVPCPEPSCQRSPCLFSHDVSARRPALSPALLDDLPATPAAKRPRLRLEQSTSPKRPAEAAFKPRAAGPPVLSNAYGSHTPLALRNEILKLLYNAFFECYERLARRRDLAYEHASEQEKLIYKATKAHSYKTLASQSIATIRKREKPAMPSDSLVGTNESVKARQADAQAQVTTRPDAIFGLTAVALRPYTLAEAPALATKDYIVEEPALPGGTRPREDGQTRNCHRCTKPFLVRPLLSDVPSDKQACRYHYGKLRTERIGRGPARRVFTCCGSTAPCSVGAHVFVDKEIEDLHARAAFVRTETLSGSGDAAAADILALDCELVYTTAGLSLARVTAVMPGSSSPVLDEFVRPPGSVLDCNTRYSGIASAEQLELKAVLDLGGIQAALGAFIGSDTILVGHGLENDLKALRIIHPLKNICDTAVLYPHPQGLPVRHSLRNLVKAYLGRFIQDSEFEGKHDSAVDAQTALELAALKVAAKGANPPMVIMQER